MSVNGYFSTEFEIKSPGNKFFQTYIEMMGLSKENATVKFDAVPFGKKKITFRMTGFQISEWYKALKGTVGVPSSQNPDWYYRKLEGTMTVTHVEDNDPNRATWTLEYKKTRPDVEDPKAIMEVFINFFKELDEYLLAR